MVTNEGQMEAVNLDEDSIITEAQAKAGLTEFGDESFRVPMRMLLKAIKEEARLNEIGLMTQRARVVGLLANRLVAEDYFKRYPEILQEEIGAPLVIVGLGRTGTTMLQRLIACDPRIFSVLWWESRIPSPLPGSENLEAGSTDPRIIDAEAEQEWIAKVYKTIEKFGGLGELIRVCEAAEKSPLAASLAVQAVPGLQNVLQGIFDRPSGKITDKEYKNLMKAIKEVKTELKAKSQ